MTLPSELIEVLTKIFHDAAKILDRNLKELVNAQQSLSLNNENFLIPKDIVTDPRYLKFTDRSSPKFSKIILELLGEWQASCLAERDDDIRSILDNRMPPNFSRKISDRILIDNHKKHRLLVLLSPLKVSSNCIDSLRENLEIELIEDLKMFLDIHYPVDSDECPIEFYSDYFYNPINNNDIQQLQTILNCLPTLVLHTSLSDYKAYFHFDFWLPYSNHILDFTLPVWYWEETLDILESAGKKERESLRIIRQIIISIQEFLTAFICDWYYLHLNFNYAPKLLQSEKIFSSPYFDSDLIAPYINIIKSIQQQEKSCQNNLLKTFSNQNKNENKKLLQKIKE